MDLGTQFCERCGRDRDSFASARNLYRDCPSCGAACCADCWNLVDGACLKCAPFRLVDTAARSPIVIAATPLLNSVADPYADLRGDAVAVDTWDASRGTARPRSSVATAPGAAATGVAAAVATVAATVVAAQAEPIASRRRRRRARRAGLAAAAAWVVVAALAVAVLGASPGRSPAPPETLPAASPSPSPMPAITAAPGAPSTQPPAETLAPDRIDPEPGIALPWGGPRVTPRPGNDGSPIVQTPAPWASPPPTAVPTFGPAPSPAPSQRPTSEPTPRWTPVPTPTPTPEP